MWLKPFLFFTIDHDLIRRGESWSIKSEKDFQLVLDLNVIQTDDGFTAEVPSIKGCESWAHSEEEAINKTVELLRYYLHSSSNQKMIIDRARKEHPLTVYKLVFDK